MAQVDEGGVEVEGEEVAAAASLSLQQILQHAHHTVPFKQVPAAPAQREDEGNYNSNNNYYYHCMN